MKYKPNNKRTVLTKYDSVPFISTKEPFKLIRSFADVTTLIRYLPPPFIYLFFAITLSLSFPPPFVWSQITGVPQSYVSCVL